MLQVDISVGFVLPISGPQIVQNWIHFFTLYFQRFGLQANATIGPTDLPLCVCTRASLCLCGACFPEYVSLSDSNFCHLRNDLMFYSLYFSWFLEDHGSKYIWQKAHSPSPELGTKFAEFPFFKAWNSFWLILWCAHFWSKTVGENLANHSHQERNEFLKKRSQVLKIASYTFKAHFTLLPQESRQKQFQDGNDIV